MWAMSSIAPLKACWLARAGVPTEPVSRLSGPTVTSRSIFMASACAFPADMALGGVPSCGRLFSSAVVAASDRWSRVWRSAGYLGELESS